MAVVLDMLNHIPASVSPSSYATQLKVEQKREGLHLHAADEHAALVEAIANQAKIIITEHIDVPSTDVRYRIVSESFGVGALVIGVPEEAPALPELITQLAEPFRGEDYFTLRAEGKDISPDYDMPSSDYKYVFNYE